MACFCGRGIAGLGIHFSYPLAATQLSLFDRLESP
jgi:hypothetical protein